MSSALQFAQTQYAARMEENSSQLRNQTRDWLSSLGQQLHEQTTRQVSVDIPTVMVSYPWGRHKEWTHQFTADLKCVLGEHNVIHDEDDNLTGQIGRFASLVNQADKIVLVATRDTLAKYERGTVNETRFTAKGLSEVLAKRTLQFLREKNLITATGFLRWRRDFEQVVQEALEPANLWPVLHPVKDNITSVLLEICKAYREGTSAVLEQEISVLEGARWRDLKQRGSIIIVLLEASPQESLPSLFRDLPCVSFNGGYFLREEAIAYAGQGYRRFEWARLPDLVTEEGTGRIALSDPCTKGLEEDTAKSSLIDIYGEELITFLGRVPSLTYSEHLVTVVQRLGVLPPEKISELTTQIQLKRRALVEQPQPSSLPPCKIIRIPGINRNFANRADYLDRLSETLARQSAGPLIVAGLGGVGKSQLAKQFAMRVRDQYDIVWWINAGTNIEQDYRDLGKELGIQSKRANIRYLIQSIQQKLCEVEHVLLIFDNVDEFELVRPYIDYDHGQSHHHFILTTRLTQPPSDWPVPIKLRPLSNPESVELISKYLVSLNGGPDPRQLNQLSEELAGLPLALVQACAYIRQSGKSIDSYKDLFARVKLDVFRGGKPADYDFTVETVWKISLEHLQQSPNYSDASQILKLCAYILPDKIPFTLLLAFLKQILSCDDLIAESRLDEIIRTATRFSLVEAENDQLSMHRLVQLCIRESFPIRDEQEILTFIRLFEWEVIFDEDDPYLMDKVSLLGHAESIIELAKRLHFFPHCLKLTWQIAKFYLLYFNDFQKSKTFLLSIVENTDDPEITAYCKGDLGFVFMAEGDYDQGRQVCQEALAFFSANPTSSTVDRKQLAQTYSNLGVLYEKLGFFREARQHHASALALREELRGPQSFYLADSLHNMGKVHLNVGQFEPAKRYLTRSLEIKLDRLKGSDVHPEVSLSMHRLAQVKLARGHHDEAFQDLQRCYDIKVEVYGTEVHPFVATIYNTQGQAALAQGNLDLAQQRFDRSLGIKRSVYQDPHHPYIPITIANMATLLFLQGQPDEAKQKFEEALATYPDTFKHPNRVTIDANLACLADKVTRQESLNEVSQGYHEFFGTHDTVFYLITQNNLVLSQVGTDPTPANQAYEDVVSLSKTILKPDDAYLSSLIEHNQAMLQRSSVKAELTVLHLSDVSSLAIRLE